MKCAGAGGRSHDIEVGSVYIAMLCASQEGLELFFYICHVLALALAASDVLLESQSVRISGKSSSSSRRTTFLNTCTKILLQSLSLWVTRQSVQCDV